MLPETTPKIPAAAALQLIEEARNAEKVRDLKALRETLENFWSDISGEPDFDLYEPCIKAELLRLSGSFLTFYAVSKGLKDLQARAKNLLTQSIEIFEQLELPEKVAEANIYLGFCYWNCGEVSEYEAIYDYLEIQFGKFSAHPICLLLSINRLVVYIYCEKKEESLKLIQETLLSIDFCADKRIKAMFHSMAAVAFRHSARYDDAANHFKEAIRLSQELKIIRFEAINYNNLSLLYKCQGNFTAAHLWAEKSHQLFLLLDDKGWIAHVLDTKSLICLDEKNYSKALELIDESLSYFYQGEDYNGLTAALWTKTRCLLRLDRAEYAFIIFGELQKIAAEQIGETAVSKFAKNLAEEIYVLRDLPFTDEVAEFKKSRIRAALIGAGGKIVKAAEILNLKNHQTLSDILNNQFPGLVGELGFTRRARRGASRVIAFNSDKILKEREISRLVLPDKSFSFDFNFSSEKFEVFYFDEFFMRQFDVQSDAVVAVVPVGGFKEGMNLLVFNEDVFMVAKTQYNDWAGIYFITDEQGSPIPLDESNVIGEPVAYCLFSAVDNKYIQFSRLS